jgi:hypothetical protein
VIGLLVPVRRRPGEARAEFHLDRAEPTRPDMCIWR